MELNGSEWFCSSTGVNRKRELIHSRQFHSRDINLDLLYIGAIPFFNPARTRTHPRACELCLVGLRSTNPRARVSETAQSLG